MTICTPHGRCDTCQIVSHCGALYEWKKKQGIKTMTRELAIKTIKGIRDYLCGGNPIFLKDFVAEALNMAIGALEKESLPCDIPKTFGVFIPEITVDELRNAPLEAIYDLFATGEFHDIDLSGYQEPKRGKWIEIDEYSECSCCGAESCGETPFCPFCGARRERRLRAMKEEQNNEQQATNRKRQTKNY